MSEPHDEYEELQGDLYCLRKKMLHIANIAKSVCIMPGIGQETIRPIKNTSRKDVYRAMLEIQYYLDSVPVKNEIDMAIQEFEMIQDDMLEEFEKGFDEEIISK